MVERSRFTPEKWAYTHTIQNYSKYLLTYSPANFHILLMKQETQLSQDEMLKNLIRDYLEDPLNFFKIENKH